MRKKLKVTPIFWRMVQARASGRFNVYVYEGGSRCFAPDQLVMTENGSKRIVDIKVGDRVASLGADGELEYKEAKNLFCFKADKPMVRIKLKNGREIRCSTDHKFLYNGEFVPIIDILNHKV